MVRPRTVDEKPKPHIAKCTQLSDALLIQMNYGFSSIAVEIVEYHNKFYVVSLDRTPSAS